MRTQVTIERTYCMIFILCFRLKFFFIFDGPTKTLSWATLSAILLAGKLNKLSEKCKLQTLQSKHKVLSLMMFLFSIWTSVITAFIKAIISVGKNFLGWAQ